MTASYHTHVAAHGLPAMVEAAGACGLAVLGISEHLFQLQQGRPLFRDAPLEGPLLDLEDYVAEVRFTALPGLRLRLGLEVDHLPARLDEIRALCAGPPWDFLLGSVHEVDGRLLRQCHPPDLAAGWRLWRRYAELLGDAVRSGCCDVLAHPLRLARHVPPPPYLGELVDPVLQAARRAAVAVELNGADLGDRPDLQEDLLRWCRSAGTRVTLGADAHSPADISQNFGLAGELLRRQGFAGLTGFTGRQPVAEALPPLRGPGGRSRVG